MGCVWGVVIGPQEQLLPKFIFDFGCSKKCLGGSRRVPGVPRTLLKNIRFPGHLHFLNILGGTRVRSHFGSSLSLAVLLLVPLRTVGHAAKLEEMIAVVSLCRLHL